jgi:hypothetical protein
MKLKEYLTESKPKKGQIVIWDLGKEYKIMTISKGFAYIGDERLPVSVKSLKPHPTEKNKWVEK